MRGTIGRGLGIALGIYVAGVAGAGELLGTFRVDPVELLRGTTVEGREEISAEHYLFRYLFSTEENRAAFLKDPGKYEIQMGGGCARMGSLSGTGKTDLYTVHDGRIYIFASTTCRAGFLSAADMLLEKDDAPIVAPEADARRAGELLDKAAQAVGGAKRLAALKSVSVRHARTVESGGVEYKNVTADTWLLPDGHRHASQWNEDTWAHVVRGDRGWFVEPDGSGRPMHAVQVREAQRAMVHEPIVLLCAREAPGFVAAADGAGTVGERAVEFVKVSYRGANTRLGIDRENGRVLSAAFRGRGPTSRYGAVERRYSDFEETHGVLLPRTVETWFEGEAVKDGKATLREFVVDEDVSADFSAPE